MSELERSGYRREVCAADGGHSSCSAAHSEPAYPAGPCDCQAPGIAPTNEPIFVIKRKDGHLYEIYESGHVKGFDDVDFIYNGIAVMQIKHEAELSLLGERESRHQQ